MNPWYLNSTTIRASLVTLVPVLNLVLKAFGIDVVPAELDKLVDGIVSLIGLIGTIYVIVGRIRAQKKIDSGK